MLASCQLRNATHPLFCAVFKTKSFVSLVVLKMSKDIFRIPDALKPFFQAVLAEPNAISERYVTHISYFYASVSNRMVNLIDNFILI